MNLVKAWHLQTVSSNTSVTIEILKYIQGPRSGPKRVNTLLVSTPGFEPTSVGENKKIK